MKVVLQRVSRAKVTVEAQGGSDVSPLNASTSGEPATPAVRVVGQIERGLVALVGIAPDDDEKAMRAVAGKMVNLRIFDDADGKMNLSVADIGGALLVVSQFTLYADCRKGRRPSYSAAAPPDTAREAFAQFVTILRETGLPVETGQFQAMMDVELVNDGPVTIILDSRDLS